MARFCPAMDKLFSSAPLLQVQRQSRRCFGGCDYYSRRKTRDQAIKVPFEHQRGLTVALYIPFTKSIFHGYRFSRVRLGRLRSALGARRIRRRHASYPLWHNIDRRYISMGAAGWHICLDVMDHALSGTPLGCIVGPQIMKFEGWQRLNAKYAKQFGMGN